MHKPHSPTPSRPPFARPRLCVRLLATAPAHPLTIPPRNQPPRGKTASHSAAPKSHPPKFSSPRRKPPAAKCLHFAALCCNPSPRPLQHLATNQSLRHLPKPPHLHSPCRTPDSIPPAPRRCLRPPTPLRLWVSPAGLKAGCVGPWRAGFHVFVWQASKGASAATLSVLPQGPRRPSLALGRRLRNSSRRRKFFPFPLWLTAI
jgi:hypothetical protein